MALLLREKSVVLYQLSCGIMQLIFSYLQLIIAIPKALWCWYGKTFCPHCVRLRG